LTLIDLLQPANSEAILILLQFMVLVVDYLWTFTCWCCWWVSGTSKG